MRSDNPKNNKNVMESLKNNKNVATSDLSESAGSVQVGDKVMILGGLSKLRGIIGTVSCQKSDPDYFNVYVPEMGKYILHVGDLLKQNKKDNHE